MMDALEQLLYEDVPYVINDISPNDTMFENNLEHYFSVGQSALKCIRIALLATGKQSREVRRILDLPCGHGRVLRTLKAAFPEAELTASDIITDGVDFCAQVLGAAPIYADRDVDKIVIEGEFDLVWCGSLLTHLDVGNWKAFLGLFTSILAEGGLLVFTSHGRFVKERIADGFDYGLDPAGTEELLTAYERHQFGYARYSYFPPGVAYGVNVSSLAWVMSFLEQNQDLRRFMCVEEGWDQHQDVFACLKQSKSVEASREQHEGNEQSGDEGEEA